MRQWWQQLDWGWKAAGLGVFCVAIFKVWLIWQVPICAFHNDSHTYLRAASMFWEGWNISIHPKRSFLYPTILTLLAPLPVRLSLTILWVQHAATLFLPLIAVRLLKEWTPAWRCLAFPLVIFLGLNVSILFYSHDMIAEAFYVTAFWLFLWKLWRFISGPSTGRFERLLWVAILCLSLRPDGKVAILIAVGALLFFGLPCLKKLSFRSREVWLRLILPALVAAGLWISTSAHVTQQGWLFHSSVFPLTNLESELHQDYKKELRPLVEYWRAHLADYPENQGIIQWQLVNPKGKSVGPLWDKLRGKGQNPRLHEVCREMAVEAVLSHPVMFVKLLAYKLRFVLDEERKYARKFLPRKIGDEWIDEMEKEPEYIPLLLANQTLDKWVNGFFAQRGSTTANQLLAKLEPITAPTWWSAIGLISLIGWLLAMTRWRLRLLFWFGSLIGYLLLTYTVARGIPRYLLPFEPAMMLGVALLTCFLIHFFQKRLGR
jgi:hypothetical protein